MWLGCTVENQEQADLRLPHLLATPATVRFISCEPLIGPVHLGLREMANGCGPRPIKTTGIDWVIVGGESGAAEKVRPFHVNWARDILTECYSSGVAPFMKQLGRLPVVIDRDGVDRTLTLPDTHGGEWGEWPANLDDLRVREFPVVPR